MTTTRRTFLQVAAATLPAFVLPGCAASARGTRPLSDKLRLGVIGVNNRGGDNLAGVAGEDIVALCDVDQNYLAGAAKQFPAARCFVDFRELIALQGLDGVVISTPDHTHYPAAALALKRGLDVYCEKPLTHTVAQARRLQKLAVARGAVTQMGTQIHANDNFRRVVEAIQAAVIGEVTSVHVFVNGTNWSASGKPPVVAVPSTLNWPLWLGPAKQCEFSADYHPANWRKYWAFGGGTTADMACHYMDLPFWALDLRHPSQVLSDGPEPDEFGAPVGMTTEYQFERAAKPPLTFKWWAGNMRPEAILAERGLESFRNGVLFIGTRGYLISNYDSHEVGPKAAFAGYKPPEQTIAKSIGHHAEWILACKQRTQPTCNFGYSGLLTEAVLLGNVCYRAARGKTLAWDAANLQLVGNELANTMLDATARQGYEA
ncbi:MAG: Gfo/Idh/MocA family oxidoreductase [Planctomycetes bacterium]|jgi:predicted dehydrogenase|nr:Gfo/Idh/MocA family oxidoreductase [Planctomycetota bacterium]